MLLCEILKSVSYSAAENILKREVLGIATDSKKVLPGYVFIALKGKDVDGNDFISDALECGAIAVIGENNILDDYYVQVDDDRIAYAFACDNFYNNPSQKLKFLGVTGTNGKTTTVSMIVGILNGNGIKTATIGTMGICYNGKTIDTNMTTPDPLTLYKELDSMVKADVKFVVMEASAHALALKKLEPINFEVGVLTNITQDHLDYFQNMENYARAKFKLFEKCKTAILNSDCPYGQELNNLLKIPKITYGLNNPCDAFAVIKEESISGTTFDCNFLDDVESMEIKLPGKFNISNALAAIASACVVGMNLKESKMPLLVMHPVEGRFNIIKLNHFTVIIDFAHTPDGLQKILETVKPLTKGALHVVFGCGGNRDKDKRHKMGRIVEELADYIYLTSDNPRFENEIDIIKDIEKGMLLKNHESEKDRGKAIFSALSKCKKGDVCVIAGKGGENYQSINGVNVPYSDFNVVSDYFHSLVKPKKEKHYEY